MADNNQDKEEKLTQFCDITGEVRERAIFFLDSANWTLQLALAGFYEQDEPELNNAVGMEVVHTVHNLRDPQSVLSQLNPPASAASSDTGGSSRTEKKPKPQPTSGPRIATIHNMANNSSDDEDEQGQAFYTGTERSGQQILGPPRKNPIKDYVSEIFRSAQESGAEMVDPSTAPHTHPSTSSGRTGGSRSFAGSGYRLGQTNDDHIKLPDPSSASSSRPSRPTNTEPVILKLWRQGFSINDGELRLYEEPGNKEFLDSIKKGEIPLELRQQGGSMVNLDLEDHRHEEYKQVPAKVKPFAGKGHTLGSPAPNVVSGVTSQQSAGTSGTSVALAPSSNPEEAEKKANEQLNVNPELPTTMIQVRLTNGSRMSIRFNHSHTIDDIRTYIITARPEYANSTFALLTTYPSKELSDGDQTIDKAGILNAALMQRLK